MALIVLSYHVMSCYFMLSHFMSCYVLSCHIVLCHVISCHVKSFHVMSCHIMLSLHLYHFHHFFSLLIHLHTLLHTSPHPSLPRHPLMTSPFSCLCFSVYFSPFILSLFPHHFFEPLSPNPPLLLLLLLLLLQMSRRII